MAFAYTWLLRFIGQKIVPLVSINTNPHTPRSNSNHLNHVFFSQLFKLISKFLDYLWWNNSPTFFSHYNELVAS